jgi:Tol biopolymer transport system component
MALKDGLGASQYSGGPLMSVSNTGTLGYLTRVIPVQRLLWRDLAGHEAGIPGFSNGAYFGLMVSPDGRRALLDGVADDLRGTVSLVDLERGTASRLSSPDEDAGSSVWSPDGRSVAYLSNNSRTLVVRSLADGSSRSFLGSDPAYKRLEAWSHDGRYLVIERLDAGSKWDVWLLPVEGDSTLRPAVRSAANDQNARLSPDGRWVAFTSDETGIDEIYVQAVDSAGLKYQVTTGGGGPWYWSRDGKSLVFQRADQPTALFRAAVQGTEEFSLGPPSLFMRLPEDLAYAYPAPDEKRFLMLRPAEKPERQTITVLQNWQAALRTP